MTHFFAALPPQRKSNSLHGTYQKLSLRIANPVSPQTLVQNFGARGEANLAGNLQNEGIETVNWQECLQALPLPPHAIHFPGSKPVNVLL
jgi:hypothetical protein